MRAFHFYNLFIFEFGLSTTANAFIVSTARHFAVHHVLDKSLASMVYMTKDEGEVSAEEDSSPTFSSSSEDDNKDVNWEQILQDFTEDSCGILKRSTSAVRSSSLDDSLSLSRSNVSAETEPTQSKSKHPEEGQSRKNVLDNVSSDVNVVDEKPNIESEKELKWQNVLEKVAKEKKQQKILGLENPPTISQRDVHKNVEWVKMLEGIVQEREVNESSSKSEERMKGITNRPAIKSKICSQGASLNLSTIDSAKNMDITSSGDGDEELEDMLDEVYFNVGDSNNRKLYDTYSVVQSHNSQNLLDEKVDEDIIRLIRSNEEPTNFFVAKGILPPPLTDSKKYDIKQLLAFPECILQDENFHHNLAIAAQRNQVTPTKFLTRAVNEIFNSHIDDGQTEQGMSRQAIAIWMSRCFKEKVGAHDKRVRTFIARYSNRGEPFITQQKFHDIYFDALTKSDGNEQRVREVWADFEAYNIKSPAEEAYALKSNNFKKGVCEQINKRAQYSKPDFFDESQVLKWSYSSNVKDDRYEKPSHELVELSDTGTQDDHSYLFVDEKRCIGCMQCVNVCPGSFKINEDHAALARVFEQNNTPDVEAAVEACPVDCIHYVSYIELKSLEISRDSGDKKTNPLLPHIRHRVNNAGVAFKKGVALNSDRYMKGEDYDHNLDYDCQKRLRKRERL